MKQRIGMITVGQSPRDDIAPAMSRILGPGIEIIQKGALDGLSDTEIKGLNEASVDLIVLLCTGHFPRFESRCLIVEAQKIVDKNLEALVDDRYTLGIVVPLAELLTR
jgi:protein AroM